MSYRILLVEDSRTQALRFQLELVHYGLKVEVASNGTKALEAARTHSPDAIVLDIDLPELDGYSICRALKADPATADIPIVMLTRYDDAQAVVHKFKLE